MTAHSLRSERRALLKAALAGAALLLAPLAPALADPTEVRIDYATYNPVSLLLKDKGFLEEALKPDGITVRWVQSAGSNKALEFLNASSLDFGSTAGAAALIGRVNGNPIKSIYVYSRPEWTALVTKPDSGIKTVADLKGKRIAVTRGTDPHVFLIRALSDAGLTEKDVKLVLLQHADGKSALLRGDVDAWAGLDPIMASAELDGGAALFFRRPEWNSWGVLDVREQFAAENPKIVQTVLAAYEKARAYAIAHPDELKAALIAAAKLPEPVIDLQLKRTDLSNSVIGDAQKETIRSAGLALQKAGVIEPAVDVPAVAEALIDASFKPLPN